MFLTSCAAVLACQAQQAEGGLRNWFNDPFFQLSADVPDCPVPLGPLLTEPERLVQSHHRAEKGTSCWLAGRCERPNFYAYDPEIALQLQAAARSHPALFAGTSLWATVQGRVVYIEGCASRPDAAAGLEAFARSVPQVHQALALLRTDARKPAPYRLKPRP